MTIDADNEFTPPNDGDFSVRRVKIGGEQEAARTVHMSVVGDPCDTYAAELVKAGSRTARLTR